jgi:AcrR family transcriptional regulator
MHAGRSDSKEGAQMPFSGKTADGHGGGRRARRWRTDPEARALIEAGLAVLRQSGAKNLTVGDVLAESGLSTRAFYRHFQSKDELILAIYQRDNRRLLERFRTRTTTAGTALAGLEAWVEDALRLGFEPRRARRTATLWREGGRLWAQYPGEYNAIVSGLVAPLVKVLARGVEDGTFPSADPELDALAIHAVVWRLVERRLGGDETLELASARAYVLRFCLPALTERRRPAAYRAAGGTSAKGWG